MEILLISVFSLGYFFIAFEHNFKIDKAAIALITGVLTWTILISFSDYKIIDNELAHHLVDIGEIVFFLLGAMTIVELVDSHQGFKLITDKIKIGTPTESKTHTRTGFTWAIILSVRNYRSLKLRSSVRI